MFYSNKDDFLRRFITMDETWVHHFTLKMKEQSKRWTEREEQASKKAKTVLCWQGHGISCLGCMRDNFH